MTIIEELIESAIKQSEMTVAIIDMMIDYNKLLKKQIEQLRKES